MPLKPHIHLASDGRTEPGIWSSTPNEAYPERNWLVVIALLCVRMTSRLVTPIFSVVVVVVVVVFQSGYIMGGSLADC